MTIRCFSNLTLDYRLWTKTALRLRKQILFLCFILVLSISSIACTTFFINKNGQLIFGRNYDWVSGNGMICTNQRGLAKTSFKTQDGETISWVSKYGSISFNQYGKEFPTGGMNENGLVIELMWLDGTRYPSPDKRPALGVLQWIQYHLDNCGDVNELIAEDKNVRIASAGTTPLHYLVADAKGNSAAIEFLDGRMVVHKGNSLPFPVLTNDRYDYSLSQTKTEIEAAYSNRVFKSNSIDRFVKACKMVNAVNTGTAASLIDYSFNILDEVSQGSHTKWSIVYDISNKKIYFKSLGYTNVKHIAFSAFNFSCIEKPMHTNINMTAKGDIFNYFNVFSIEMNEQMIAKSFEESRNEVQTSDETIRQLGLYPAGVLCKSRFP